MEKVIGHRRAKQMGLAMCMQYTPPTGGYWEPNRAAVGSKVTLLS